MRILRQLSNPEFHRRLQLMQPLPGQVLNPSDGSIADDTAILSLAVEFALNLSANYAWGQQLFAWTLPFAAGALLAGSHQVRNL